MIQIYNNDCRDVIPVLSNDSIDLVITSPPYNVKLGDNKYNKIAYDEYDDSLPYDEYLSLIETTFQELYSKVKIGGRVAINVADTKNGRIPLESDVTQLMVKNKWLPYSHIIWQKNNIGNRTAWGSWKSPSSPFFLFSFEHILLFAKETYKLQYKGETDLERDEFIQWTNAYWVMSPESKKRVKHPAPFPKELPYRLIKMLSWKGATVFDPFGGSGTTVAVANDLDRDGIMCDVSKQYCEYAHSRVKESILLNIEEVTNGETL